MTKKVGTTRQVIRKIAAESAERLALGRGISLQGPSARIRRFEKCFGMRRPPSGVKRFQRQLETFMVNCLVEQRRSKAELKRWQKFWKDQFSGIIDEEVKRHRESSKAPVSGNCMCTLVQKESP